MILCGSEIEIANCGYSFCDQLFGCLSLVVCSLALGQLFGWLLRETCLVSLGYSAGSCAELVWNLSLSSCVLSPYVGR